MKTLELVDRRPLTKDELAALVARDIPSGSYVNLGIGLPTQVNDYLSAEQAVTLHTENGMLGMGPEAAEHDTDDDLINAGKVPVTETPGCSYFHHADSFAMMRGGHLDLCVLGAFQVSTRGDLANWHTGAPGAIPAVGGAMDLAIGAQQVFVMMTLFAKDGTPKLVPELTLPVTALGCVSRVYSDVAVLAIAEHGVELLATFGTTGPQLESRLGFRLHGAPGPFHPGAERPCPARPSDRSSRSCST
jgi:3-oxoadipate CoA-transferase beta subunit